VSRDCAVGWWEDSRFVSMPCQLIDLSLSGCMIKSRRIPSRIERQPVLLRPGGPESSAWVEGMIVSVRKMMFRDCQIRIGFLAPFPYELFKTLVFGPDHCRELAPPVEIEHEQDGFWR
jgi:hypothetical protein